MASSALDTLLAKSAKKWNSCGEGENTDCDLRRLAVLRDLVHALHAEKSRFLSSGKSKDASILMAIENRIEELRQCKPLDGDLIQLLSKNITLKKQAVRLPENLFKVLDRGKLERYDRVWELSLTSEALALGWGIWSLEAWVDLGQVDEWNRRFNQELEPFGLTLYVESAENGEKDATKKNAWHGRWICILRSQFQFDSEIPIDFRKFSKNSERDSKNAPRWQLLFNKEMNECA